MGRDCLFEPTRRDGGWRALFIIEEQGESQAQGFYDRICLTQSYRRSSLKFYQGEFDLLRVKCQVSRFKDLTLLTGLSTLPGRVFDLPWPGP
ncbi:hypothetical protein ES707_12332 [subsurface metagenome]